MYQLHDRADIIAKYLKDKGVSSNQIFFSRKNLENVVNKEKIEIELKSRFKGIDLIKEGLKDVFSEKLLILDKTSDDNVKITALKENIFTKDSLNLNNDFKIILDLIVKAMKDDKDSTINIRDYITVSKKKWYEQGWVIGLFAFFIPLIGAIFLFTNKHLSKLKKIILGLFTLGWGLFSYAGIMNLGKLGMLNLPKGLTGMFSVLVPLIGAGMIFFNKYLSKFKKILFGLLTLGWGLFSFNGLMKLGNLFTPKTAIEQVEKIETTTDTNIKKAEEKVTTEVVEVNKTTLNIFNTLETKLKDVLLKNDLTLNKISDKEIRLVAHNNVSFDSNSAVLNPEFQKVLDTLVTALKENENYRITIEGYTDNTGTDEINNQLSKERAEHVAKYLENEGVSANRITVVGNGSKNPIATNDTEEGRATNRRIEMSVISN